MWILGTVLLVISLIIIFFQYEWTPDRAEYSPPWWFMWGLATAGGLLIIAHFAPLRSSYLIISSIVAAVFALSFVLGKFDDEFAPTAWLGLGVLLVNGLVALLGFLPTAIIAGVLALIGVILIPLGLYLHSKDEYHYDSTRLIGWAAVFTSALLFTHTVMTPLEYTNEVLVPDFNEQHEVVTANIVNYDPTVSVAQQCQANMEEQYGEEGTEAAAVILSGTEHFGIAAVHHETALNLFENAGQPIVEAYADHTEEMEQTLRNRIETISQSRIESNTALDTLNNVCYLARELGVEWKVTYTWFEIDRFWPNESSDSNHLACYYGENRSELNEAGEWETVVVDEEGVLDGNVCSGVFCADKQGTNWKVFRQDDYAWLVNNGVVPAMPGNDNPNDTDIAYYLCGADPANEAYGVLEPGFSIIKDYGQVSLYSEDQEGMYVGDYRLGSWCYQQADGTLGLIDEDTANETEDAGLPENTEWCWHQPTNKSTRYYWFVNGTRGPLRCVYCSYQTTWSGSNWLTDQELARVNATTTTLYRRPSDVGGGPGAGK